MNDDGCISSHHPMANSIDTCLRGRVGCDAFKHVNQSEKINKEQQTT
jgi:hypothetical protein